MKQSSQETADAILDEIVAIYELGAPIVLWMTFYDAEDAESVATLLRRDIINKTDIVDVDVTLHQKTFTNTSEVHTVLYVLDTSFDRIPEERTIH